MREFEFFKEISKIPRGSGNEKAIADYLVAFADKRGLFCLRDDCNNVFIRRTASNGFEDRAPTLLQAHTDMVCEKELGSEHDFMTDEIKLVIKNGRVSASGTTLGGDDGAGVAVMLDILDDTSFEAGEIECLFTSSEETGMEGAFGFDYTVINSERMINLDSEEELNACIGCAGGMRCNAEIPIERTRTEGKLYRIEVSGLAGGHSGMEIDKGRQSAFELLAYTLDRLYSLYPLHIVDLVGGGRDNVIPPAATATVAFYSEDDIKKAEAFVKQYHEEIKATLSADDKRRFAMKMTKVKQCESAPESMLTLKSSSNVISAIMLAPQGVSASTPDTHIVLASANLGTLSLKSDKLHMGFLIRSGNRTYSDMTAASIERMAHSLGGRSEIESSYPGWDFRTGGAMQNAYTEACEEVFGKKPIFTVIHAGLECGIISSRLRENGKDPDIISIGPDVTEIHTPKESMDIDSLSRMNRLVRIMLLK